MSTILITGGTGLVGIALCKLLLEKGNQPIVLGRSIPEKKIEGVQYALWDIEKQEIDMEALMQADHIVHLAGASVFEKRWTQKRKKEILESRTRSADLLVKSLSNHVHQVKSIVSASAIGWYGPDSVAGKAFTEDDGPDAGFLGQVCKEWEQHIEAAEAIGLRVTKLRFGLVLSNKGGFMEPIQKPLNMGLAVIPGGGQQMMSWIYIRDLTRLILFAIENENVKGSINAVAPQPVPLEWLVKSYAGKIRKNAWLSVPVPGFVLKLVLGERSTEVTKSCTVSCSLIKSFGFTFLVPSGEAVVNILATNPHE
jgi:uncharacterized protein (TIGR01777 family)